MLTGIREKECRLHLSIPHAFPVDDLGLAISIFSKGPVILFCSAGQFYEIKGNACTMRALKKPREFK